MPPSAKFTKKQIIEAALDIVREESMENLTARTLGKKLGSSSCPIFTVFKNMEEVRSEVKRAAKDLYGEYVKRGLEETLAFQGVGMQYIRFAMQEQKLFQLLFMSEQPQKLTITNILSVIDERQPLILQFVKEVNGMSEKEAENLHQHMWIYAHGIAVLCATNMCTFTLEEIEKMLTEVYTSVLNKMKNEVKNPAASNGASNLKR